MPKRRVNLCINDETWQRLQRHAANRRISASAAVEEAIDRAVEDEELRRQRAMDAWEAIKNLDLGPMPDPDELCREINEMYGTHPGLEP